MSGVEDRQKLGSRCRCALADWVAFSCLQFSTVALSQWPADPCKILSHFHSSLFRHCPSRPEFGRKPNYFIIKSCLIDFLPYYPQSLRHGRVPAIVWLGLLWQASALRASSTENDFICALFGVKSFRLEKGLLAALCCQTRLNALLIFIVIAPEKKLIFPSF